MDWSIVAVLAFTGMSQLFFAAAWVVVGGLGGQWRVNKTLAQQAEEISHLDRKLTRDQKVRAGERRQENVREAKSIEIQAAEALAAAQPVHGVPSKPSTLGVINGGPK